MNGKSRTEVAKQKLDAQNADFWARKEAEKQEAIEKRAEKERAAAEKQAEADRKKAEATKESRAAAAEEYRLENAILAARLKGDAARLAKLEREKAIREEIKRLESAGFTPAEARKPAEAKVDAEKKAEAKDARAKAAMEEKRKAQKVLAGKVNESRDKLENLQYQSSVGAVSSMQRIGGGGGAVASGLDYARQQSDLQREANGYLRQLIEVSRQPLDY
jgi:colicin import membrane protein